MLTNVKFWLWLTNLLPPVPAWQVYCHFGSPEQAYFSDPAEYAQIEHLSPAQQKILENKDVSAAEAILARCDGNNIRILTFSDTDYPERLRNIEVPPLVLYAKGKLFRFDERAVIAMAGTRHATPYGQKMAGQFAHDIVRLGGIVATGAVTGCDDHAARGALLAGGALALVLAGGVDVPYYSTDSSRALLEDTAAVGCILSESPPGTPHSGALFRRRNTILSGISVGLLCVEAGVRSGTLGVAALASEQGKDVFAIPANLGAKQSQGTNELLRSGIALPVLSAKDILSRYDHLMPRPGSQPPRDFTRWKLVKIPAAAKSDAPSKKEQDDSAVGKTEVPSAAAGEKGVDTATKSRYIELLDTSERWRDEERKLLRALLDGPATTEALIAATELNAALVSATLVMLAVNGAVEALPGGQYRLILEGLV